MAEGALPLHKNKRLLSGPLSYLQHGLLNGASGVIDPHRIKRHPTATLPLMRGSQANSLLLVHRAGQRSIRNLPEIALPPLPELIAVVEALARLARPQGQDPARVKAIALNTALLDDRQAAAAIEQTTQETGCCCADPVRGGADRLLEALLS